MQYCIVGKLCGGFFVWQLVNLVYMYMYVLIDTMQVWFIISVLGVHSVVWLLPQKLLAIYHQVVP